MTDIFACNITALTKEQRTRHLAIARDFLAKMQEVEELPDGYVFSFTPDTELASELAEFIGLERLCCPFLDLTMSFERNAGPLRLTLRGSEGVKPFLVEEFGLKLH
jgi:hypothetical protein